VQFGGGLATSLIREYGPLPVVAMRILFGALLLLGLPARSDPGRRARRSGGLPSAGSDPRGHECALLRGPVPHPARVAVTIEFWGPLTVAVIGSRRLLDWSGGPGRCRDLHPGRRRVGADDFVGVAASSGGVLLALYIGVGGRVAREWPDGRGLTLAMVVRRRRSCR